MTGSYGKVKLRVLLRWNLDPFLHNYLLLTLKILIYINTIIFPRLL